MDLENSPTPEGSDRAQAPFEESAICADMLLHRLEIGVRSQEPRVFREAIGQLIHSREQFERAVPRMIELLTDHHGGTSSRAAQVLIARPHWIGAEILNQELIPTIRSEIADGDSMAPLKELIFGLTPGAAHVEDRNVRLYFGLAHAALFGRPVMQRELATLSLFSARIPPRHLGMVLESMIEVVDVMGWVIGNQIQDFVDPQALCSSTAAGVYLLRDRIRENLDRHSESVNCETLLVKRIEQVISEFATSLERGTCPNRFEQYQLLLTYPLLVEDNRDIATEQNLDLIERELGERIPPIRTMLFQVRDASFSPPSLTQLEQSFPTQPDPVFDLSLMIGLMMTVRQCEQRALWGGKLSTSRERLQHELAMIERLPLEPMIFPLYAESARIVGVEGEK